MGLRPRGSQGRRQASSVWQRARTPWRLKLVSYSFPSFVSGVAARTGRGTLSGDKEVERFRDYLIRACMPSVDTGPVLGDHITDAFEESQCAPIPLRWKLRSRESNSA